jgi:hypothetical protein
LQNGLQGKQSEGPGIRALIALNNARVRFKIVVSLQLRSPPPSIRICKLNQNIMTEAAGPFGTSSGVCDDRANDWRSQRVAGGQGRAIFELPLGHRRFSVKGSVIRAHRR